MTSATDSDLEQRAELLDSWVEKRRQIARLEAEASDLLAERMRLSRSDSDENPFHRDAIHRSMIAEYSAAGRLTQGSVEYAFTDAGFLAASHPGVRSAFRAGRITAAHVREIVRAAGVVREAVNNGRADADVLPLYDTVAVIVAERETPARTRAHLRELAAVLAGSTVAERHARSKSERTVTVRPAGDGLCALTVVLPEHLATAVLDRLTRLAHVVIAGRNDREPTLDPMDDGENPIYPDDIAQDDPSRDDYAIFGDGTFTTDPTGPTVEHIPSDTRTIDQVRVDLLIDLLLASDPSAANGSGLDNIQGRIQVTVAATTLAGCDHRPAQLDGHGPLHPDIARDLAGRNGGWSRLFLDPTGLVVETDTYRPTEPMRRFLRARDQHCRFPGCRMPAHRCQIDHTFDHAKGGRTEIHNLAHLCARHHSLKHPDVADDHRWTAQQLPDGTIDWFSPLGRTYRDSPSRRVMFV
ncbi:MULTISPECIES: HNH endonuclease signature motif containing protein [Microbacterium]|uniref:HNH endonuclease signature motif containing protein n=1 Tax=Microbacterium TaxID=33882 RepID=UPI00099FE56D|nr:MULTISPECIES: HNH endonuclease signature motif containing protein [Microbacterium]AQY02891.1 HNH endonuclease [Microbacterium foliorum]